MKKKNKEEDDTQSSTFYDELRAHGATTEQIDELFGQSSSDTQSVEDGNEYTEIEVL